MARNRVKVARTVKDLRRIVGSWRKAGETVGLIPTMGALHDGHMALVREARARCDRTVTSIFVNPTQFAPNEDFSKYPRTFETDLEKLAGAGGDLVWAPLPQEMYTEDFATRIVPGGPAEGLESDYRPHFFSGVATVCTKLFTQVAPDIAMFGEKDYQQLRVVTQTARDLDLPLTIVPVATIREPDGLAMSSRNRYLSADERAIAPALHAALSDIATALATEEGGASPRRIAALAVGARRKIGAAGFRSVDYVEVRDADTLKPVQAGSDRPLRILAAAWLGKTRLIDNIPAGRATRSSAARKAVPRA
jgi:pantoate--beta-alanine ligase